MPKYLGALGCWSLCPPVMQGSGETEQVTTGRWWLISHLSHRGHLRVQWMCTHTQSSSNLLMRLKEKLNSIQNILGGSLPAQKSCKFAVAEQNFQTAQYTFCGELSIWLRRPLVAPAPHFHWKKSSFGFLKGLPSFSKSPSVGPFHFPKQIKHEKKMKNNWLGLFSS